MPWAPYARHGEHRPGSWSEPTVHNKRPSKDRQSNRKDRTCTIKARYGPIPNHHMTQTPSPVTPPRSRRGVQAALVGQGRGRDGQRSSHAELMVVRPGVFDQSQAHGPAYRFGGVWPTVGPGPSSGSRRSP